jgi:hypothetical protein
MTLRFAARLIPLFVFALAFAACQQQGQGAPCSTENGSNDCQSGLTCVSVSGVDGTRCCPSGPSTSSDCTSSGTSVDANAPPSGDGSSGADSGGDATVPDASGDAPFEESTDGPQGAMPEASSGNPEASIAVDAGRDASSD